MIDPHPPTCPTPLTSTTTRLHVSPARVSCVPSRAHSYTDVCHYFLLHHKFLCQAGLQLRVDQQPAHRTVLVPRSMDHLQRAGFCMYINIVSWNNITLKLYIYGRQAAHTHTSLKHIHTYIHTYSRKYGNVCCCHFPPPRRPHDDQ